MDLGVILQVLQIKWDNEITKYTKDMVYIYNDGGQLIFPYSRPTGASATTLISGICFSKVPMQNWSIRTHVRLKQNLNPLIESNKNIC